MSKQGVVTGDGVRLRDAPVDGNPVSAFDKGTRVEVEDTWHKVTIDGNRGWISATYVKMGEVDETSIPHELTPPSHDVDLVRIKTWPPADTHFISNSPIQVDESFFPAMTRMDRYAAECGVEIWVTHSFRRAGDHLTGTVVVPSKRSNHLVGHAIDMNVKAEGRLWVSANMAKSSWSRLPQSVIDFLNKIRRDGQLRWGGDFVRPDTVHIDDDLWRRDSAAWTRKYKALA